MSISDPGASVGSCAAFVVPVVPERGLIESAIDLRLSELAQRKDRNTPALRNALFEAYLPRLKRMLRRLWYRSLHGFGCEYCDLEQELFLIFATLLERWTGTGSFSAYIHGAFPWRLFDAARRFAPSWRSIEATGAIPLATDESHAAEEALLMIEEISTGLEPFDRQLLLAIARDGRTISEFARATGLSHRTVHRAWRRLQTQLQQDHFAESRATIGKVSGR